MTPIDFLQDILQLKKERLQLCDSSARLKLRDDARSARESSTRRHLLRAALTNKARVNIIAEFKRASPSKGSLNRGATPAGVARAYEDGGAAAVSVLTEENRFLGSLKDLELIRQTVSLPVLRKDFIIDEAQVYEAALAGADALLLIVAALDDDQLRSLRRLTEEVLEMDALVEVHTREELRRAGNCGASLIGVNNRDLRTFQVTLDVSEELARSAPKGALMVSESGIERGADICRLRACGYHGFLIGEKLMKAEQPAEALRALMREAG